MKEININIEGYNVNGICVGCLNYNRKMYYNNQIQTCFKLLADIDVPDGLCIQVCWECLAAVRAAMRFRAQITEAFEVLISYSHEHTFLNSPKDLCQYARERLKMDQLTSEIVIKTEVELERDVKVEDDIEHTYFDGGDSVDDDGVDATIDDFESELKLENDGQPLEGTLDQGLTSDEDIQLSKLKKKKDKKNKKSKRDSKGWEEGQSEQADLMKEASELLPSKKSRKLKNLPESLVELYTMSEEEMLRVRSEDLMRPEFQKLKFKCEDCIMGFNTPKFMSVHMKGKHRPKSSSCTQCHICKSYFLTKDNMTLHQANHLLAYRCLECGLVTSLKPVMLDHVSSHAQIKLECETCGDSFSTKSKLLYHKGVCQQEKPQCDCCGKVFANKMTLKYHLKILPQNNKPKEKLYIQCKGCDKVFHSKKSYRSHVVIHNGLTYPCPICGKEFQWKRNLSRHTRNHKDKERGAQHSCRECGKTFSSRDCYNNHMKLSKRHVAYDALGHVCSYCGKRFATKWCMVDHIDWDHLKTVKYQCSVCFKPFKTAKIMVAHMNNIHGNKNKDQETEGEHLCDICGKSYKTVKRLKGHVWAMHKNRATSKTFKCALCPATFSWPTSVYKHNKMMHSDNRRTKREGPTVRLSIKKNDHQFSGIESVQYFPGSLTNDVIQTHLPIGLVHSAHNMPQP